MSLTLLTEEKLADTAQLLDNATVTTNQAFTIDIGAAHHIDLLVSVGTPTGTSPTIQFFIDAVESVSGNVVATYNGVQLTASEQDYISIDATSVVVGDRIQVRATVGGTIPSFPSVYARLVVKV